MLASDSHNFLFVHIPKSAGTSVRKALGHLGYPRPNGTGARLGRYLGLPRNWRKYRFHPHAPFTYLEKRIPANELERMYKFSFVRNPWARFASEYEHLRRHTSNRHNSKIINMSMSEYLDFAFGRGERLQRDFLLNSKGEIGVDFVGKFETLKQDFAIICKTIGVDIELPHANANPVKKDWRELYDREAREKVRKLFAADVDCFGYEFD